MLIVDMPMPRFCGECELLDEDYEVCRATKQYAVAGDNRPSWCPIKGELVRCKDCKWFDGENCCEKIGIIVIDAELFYCANGERRTE